MIRIKTCVYVIIDNLNLLIAHIAAKFRDDLLIGTEHSYKVTPACDTPQEAFLREQGNSVTSIEDGGKGGGGKGDCGCGKGGGKGGGGCGGGSGGCGKGGGGGCDDISDDDKKKIVIADPKFGMFSLFKYHMTRGYKNEVLKRKNAVYCSHIFSTLGFLPIIVFMSQWSMYIALIANQIDNYDKESLCPNEAPWKEKLIMFGACGLYFVKSFFLWDNLTDRTRLNKMIPACDTWTMLDTFQEFGFNLFVYGANIWIIFVGQGVDDMVLDCLAMEFLMNLDNEFEELYFEYLPEAAVDIYDNCFITYKENYDMLEKKNKYCSFCCLHCLTFIPFKLLLTALMLFPAFCFAMMIYTPLCK